MAFLQRKPKVPNERQYKGISVRSMANRQIELLAIDGHEAAITHPDKLYFSKEVRLTKIDLARYYLSVAPGALKGILDRPIVAARSAHRAQAPHPFGH